MRVRSVRTANAENSLLQFGISLFFTEYSMVLGRRVVFPVPSARADTGQPARDEIGALMAAVNA
jgi:hypothetical protein